MKIGFVVEKLYFWFKTGYTVASYYMILGNDMYYFYKTLQKNILVYWK